MEICITNLEKLFKYARKKDFKFIGVKVWMQGIPKEEIIINTVENFVEGKMDYYKNAYNEDLTLKNAPDKVRIVGFACGVSFDQIEKELLGKSSKQSITIDVKVNIDEKEIEEIAKEAHEKLIRSLQNNIKCQKL